VWGDQAYRGQSAVIRRHAPTAKDFVNGSVRNDASITARPFIRQPIPRKPSGAAVDEPRCKAGYTTASTGFAEHDPISLQGGGGPYTSFCSSSTAPINRTIAVPLGRCQRHRRGARLPCSTAPTGMTVAGARLSFRDPAVLAYGATIRVRATGSTKCGQGFSPIA
jgi:hypothetical protein